MSKSKDLREAAVRYQPEKLKTYVAEYPDNTQEEVSVVFGCCPQAISKAYKRLGITRKKTLHYKEQNEVKEYLEEIKDIPKEKIVYINETGIIYVFTVNMDTHLSGDKGLIAN